MKKFLLTISISIITISGIFAQNKKEDTDFTIKSEVTFDIKPDYRKSNTTKNAGVIIFKISVTNNGDTPIPDLGATQRSDHLNFILNDSIQNPLSLYNGIEIIGDHLILKGKTATYEWWVYTDDGYGDVFTIQWEYMKVLSSKHKVNCKTQEITLINK
jgi:hypothetical protein